MRRRALGRAKNQHESHEHLFFPSAQYDDTLSLWKTISSPQSRLSADSVLEFPPSPPLRPYLHCVYAHTDLPGRLGDFQDSMVPARMQTRIIPTAPSLLSVSARKLCLLSEKNFSLSDNGQCRTIHKRKANNRFANCCSLANRHSAGIQRKMIRTNRGRGLESNARPLIPDKPCRGDKVGRPDERAQTIIARIGNALRDFDYALSI